MAMPWIALISTAPDINPGGFRPLDASGKHSPKINMADKKKPDDLNKLERNISVSAGTGTELQVHYSYPRIHFTPAETLTCA
jgi:hypothetical protein